MINLRKPSIVLLCGLVLLAFSGCATVPSGQLSLPSYNINGVSYLPLVSLCAAKGIALDYDTFTRSAVLRKDTHRINLMVGEKMILVDGATQYLSHPPEIYQGTLAVPDRFKEQVVDSLFKETYPARKVSLPLATIRKIVIDAGHGGNDPGAIGRRGLREKDVTLDIAKRVGNLLKNAGVSVTMTRSRDIFVPLSRRVEIANAFGADLFLSIHANANRVRSLHGFEVYYASFQVNDSQRALDAAKELGLDLEDAYFASSRSLDLKATLWDMLYTYNRAESIELAQALCQSTDRNLNRQILGIKGANFYVLKRARMPAVLVEIGFLSNSEEEGMLRNGYHRQQIASSIAEGIEDYARDLILAQGEVKK